MWISTPKSAHAAWSPGSRTTARLLGGGLKSRRRNALSSALSTPTRRAPATNLSQLIVATCRSLPHTEYCRALHAVTVCRVSVPRPELCMPQCTRTCLSQCTMQRCNSARAAATHLGRRPPRRAPWRRLPTPRGFVPAAQAGTRPDCQRPTVVGLSRQHRHKVAALPCTS